MGNVQSWWGMVKRRGAAIMGACILAAMLLALAAACASPTSTPAATPTTSAAAATPTAAPTATSVPTPTPAPVKKITLVAATHNPPTTAYGMTIQKFAELVGKYTNGQVELKIHYAEALVKGRDMLNGVKDGLTDLGSLTFSYFPADLPFSNRAGMIPFAWDYEGARALVPVLRPIFDEELSKFNNKMLWTTPQAIEWMFTKPVDPANPSFAGMKIRTPGEPWSSVIKSFGGAAVSMASSEIQMAFKTGVIDGATTTWTAYDAWDMHQEVGYLIETDGFINIGNPWTMNMQKFNSLPKDVQDAIMKAADETQKYAIDFSIETDAAMVNKFKTKAKRVDILTPAQRETWKNKLAFLDDDFIAKHGDAARKMLALVRK